MRGYKTIVGLLLFLFLLNGFVEAARFTVVNKTDDDLYELYVAPHRKTKWSGELLKGKVLGKNKQNSISWGAGTILTWDVRGVDSRGRTYNWTALDIRETDKIILYNLKAKAVKTIGEQPEENFEGL